MSYLFSFLIPFIAGLYLIYQHRKKQEQPDYFLFLSSWTLFSLFVYLSIVEMQNRSFFILIPILSFLLFLFSYRKQKTRLFNGLLFNVFLLVFSSYLLFNYFSFPTYVTLGLLVILGVIAVSVLLFGTLSLLILLYWNGVVMFRRESHSFANLLTLLLAIGLTLFLIYDLFIVQQLPDWLRVLLSILPMSLIYFSIAFLNFLSVSLLYQFNQPKYKQDCIIVLGAGLINGERVSPLLAQRIDRAIAFYHTQTKYFNRPPKLLMSGGQGSDEKVSEAVAMKQYALSQGIPVEHIWLETNSTTTFENMKFSKEVIQQKIGSDAKVIFASNNYHIFRAGIFARMAGLKADGLGSRTAFYFLPTAFLREFIAIIAMKRKRHFTLIGILAVLLLLLTFISWYTNS